MLDQRQSPFDRSTPMYHGTAAAPFMAFHSCRPCFFASNRNYAEVYMERGPGTPRIIEVRLDVQRPFTSETAQDVAFWNEGFVPWMKEKYPDMARTLTEIAIAEPIPSIWADEFFVYLRRMHRSGMSRYDGVIVDERSTEWFVEGEGVTVIPLHVSQIEIVHDGSKTRSSPIFPTIRPKTTIVESTADGRQNAQ